MTITFIPESHLYFDVYNCKMMINLLFGVGRNYVIVQKGGVHCLPLAISCWSHYSIVDCAVSYVNTTTTHRRCFFTTHPGLNCWKLNINRFSHQWEANEKFNAYRIMSSNVSSHMAKLNCFKLSIILICAIT